MKENVFGPKMREALVAAGDDGLTTTELSKAVECSRQRAYTWVKSHEAQLRAVDTSSTAGIRYAWVGTDREPASVTRLPYAGEPAETPPARDTLVADGPELQVGTTAKVVRIAWVKGATKITWLTSDGLELVSYL